MRHSLKRLARQMHVDVRSEIEGQKTLETHARQHAALIELAELFAQRIDEKIQCPDLRLARPVAPVQHVAHQYPVGVRACLGPCIEIFRHADQRGARVVRPPAFLDIGFEVCGDVFEDGRVKTLLARKMMQQRSLGDLHLGADIAQRCT